MSDDWVKNKELEHAKKLAEDHWEWFKSILELIMKQQLELLHKVSVDEFIHGYHHGEEDNTEKLSEG